ITFILNNSQLGFGLPMQLSTIIGVVSAFGIAAYVIKISKGKGDIDLADEEEKEAKGVTKTA
ncbi:carbon starvation protein A, partial [Vibrio sp. F13]